LKGLGRLFSCTLFLTLCLPALPPRPLSAAVREGTVFVRLPTTQQDRALPPGITPLQTLEYGSFAWLELRLDDLNRLERAGIPFEVDSSPFTLHLGGEAFDPLQEGASPPAGWEATEGTGPDLHLVQFRGPIRSEWLDGLRSHGWDIVQYIHPFTYVVWGEDGPSPESDAAEFVRWTAPFAPIYRVLPQWRDLSDIPVQVDVLIYRGADVDAVLQALEALGGEHLGFAPLNEVFGLATFRIPGSALQPAAHVAGVYSIQLEPTDGGLRGEVSNQVSVSNVDSSDRAFPGYRDWLAALGNDGAGVIIASVDAGVDENHPDLAGRFISCMGPTCAGSATSDHGTHTAGIMAADGASGVLDGLEFLRALGMAPGASLVEQLYSPWYTYAGGLLTLMTESHRNGASLSGNSWGPSGTPRGYDNDTMQVDIGTRDSDPRTPGNQSLIYVLSIMNGFGGYQTQGTPDEAKNILSVGSTRMQRYYDGEQLEEVNDLSYNTAHGPALDGRNIPHLVAPGCFVDSALQSNRYGLLCGTSMASPHASGAVALFVENYRGRTGADPSPALVKAAFLPMARDLAGHLDADGNILGHRFDSKQGWGRLDAGPVLDPQVQVAYFDSRYILDETGQVWSKELRVGDPGEPLHMMLVWTDAPGHGLGGDTPAWNNDLDLILEADGNSYRGNGFGPDGWSVPGGVADRMNNTEGVFLSSPLTSTITVRVVASNINSDGVPGQGDDTDQDFALVCYNCQPMAIYTYYFPFCAW
jgi:serine protease AprX